MLFYYIIKSILWNLIKIIFALQLIKLLTVVSNLLISSFISFLLIVNGGTILITLEPADRDNQPHEAQGVQPALRPWLAMPPPAWPLRTKYPPAGENRRIWYQIAHFAKHWRSMTIVSKRMLLNFRSYSGEAYAKLVDPPNPAGLIIHLQKPDSMQPRYAHHK